MFARINNKSIYLISLLDTATMIILWTSTIEWPLLLQKAPSFYKQNHLFNYFFSERLKYRLINIEYQSCTTVHWTGARNDKRLIFKVSPIIHSIIIILNKIVKTYWCLKRNFVTRKSVEEKNTTFKLVLSRKR